MLLQYFLLSKNRLLFKITPPLIFSSSLYFPPILFSFPLLLSSFHSYILLFPLFFLPQNLPFIRSSGSNNRRLSINWRAAGEASLNSDCRGIFFRPPWESKNFFACWFVIWATYVFFKLRNSHVAVCLSQIKSNQVMSDQIPINL